MLFPLLAILLSPGAISAQGTLYTDPLKRFTVQVPEGWTTQDLGDQGAVLSGSGLSLLITPLTGLGTPQEVVANLVAGVRWRNLEEIDRREIAIAGQSAAWIIFQGTDSTGRPGTIRVLGMRGGGVTAGVVINGEHANYMAQRGTIEAILVTLRLGTNPPIVLGRSVGGDSTSANVTPPPPRVPASPRVGIGVEVRDINDDDVQELDLDDERGALVEDVTTGGPADRAGIQPSDVILQVDRTAVESAADFERVLGDHRAGDSVELLVTRHGRNKPVILRVEAAP